jgi:hypothetical protein
MLANVRRADVRSKETIMEYYIYYILLGKIQSTVLVNEQAERVEVVGIHAYGRPPQPSAAMSNNNVSSRKIHETGS